MVESYETPAVCAACSGTWMSEYLAKLDICLSQGEVTNQQRAIAALQLD